MKFNPDEYRELARNDFEHAWNKGPEIIDPVGAEDKYPRYRYKSARRHPIAETTARLREAYLSIGFDEARVPLFIDEKDVYRQFGPEASAVLDRVFYLGGLPRPNVGVGKERVAQIERIIGRELGEDGEERLRGTLHAYKKA